MALSVARHRRAAAAAPSSSSSPERYTKEGKEGRRGEADEGGGAMWWVVPMAALGMLRHMSATSNIIHDCDEVFNYWEPLHFLLYKSGFQTWEYR